MYVKDYKSVRFILCEDVLCVLVLKKPLVVLMTIVLQLHHVRMCKALIPDRHSMSFNTCWNEGRHM